MSRNLELKAIDTDPDRSLEVCETLEATVEGILIQQDTYFNVPRGRLKLRREQGGTPHLIAYERSNDVGQRKSHYWIAEVEEDQKLEAALSSVLDVTVVVAKTRRLFIWEGVRIHLDRVEGLGNFIEFEAVAATEAADFADYETRLDALCHSFHVNDADLIGESYCDLVLAKATPSQ